MKTVRTARTFSRFSSGGASGGLTSTAVLAVGLLGAAAAGGTILLAGCGGGGGASNLPTPSTSRAAGKAQIKVTWPVASSKAAHSRLIPADANSIVVTFLSGTTILQTQTIARPTTDASSPPTQITTNLFSNLPQGPVSVVATAYPNADGTGTAQAVAQTTATITAGQTTPIGMTLATTITKIDITPESFPVTVDPVTLTATAYDADGNIVLTNQWSWTDSDSSVVSLQPNGPTAVAQIVGPGDATVTATETQSGISLSESLEVISQGPSPSGSPTPTPAAIDATYFGKYTGSDTRLDSISEQYTHPQLDPNNNFTGQSQVDNNNTTTTDQSFGFADEYLDRNIDQVTLPVVGTVNRTTYFDDEDNITSRTYWTSDNNAYVSYGADYYAFNGIGTYLQKSIRFGPPGETIPANLHVGQTYATSMPYDEILYNPDGSIQSNRIYSEKYSVTLDDFEDVDSEAGYYPGAAKIDIEAARTFSPAGGAYTLSSGYSSLQWLYPYIGALQAQTTITTNGVNQDSSTYQPNVYPTTDVFSDYLISGDVGDAAYGGDKQVRAAHRAASVRHSAAAPTRAVSPARHRAQAVPGHLSRPALREVFRLR